MSWIVKISVSLILLIAAVLIIWQNNSNKDIVQLMLLNERLGYVQKSVIDSIDINKPDNFAKKTSAITHKKLKKTVLASLKFEKMLNDIRNQISSELSKQELKYITTQLKTSLNKKITMEQALSLRLKSTNKVLLKNISNEKLKIIREIITLLSLEDHMFKVQANISKISFVANYALKNPGETANLLAFNSLFEKFSQDLYTKVKNLVLLQNVYIYKDISLNDLKKHFQFIQRPEVTKLYKIINLVQLKYITASANNLSDLISKEYATPKNIVEK